MKSDAFAEPCGESPSAVGESKGGLPASEGAGVSIRPSIMEYELDVRTILNGVFGDDFKVKKIRPFTNDTLEATIVPRSGKYPFYITFIRLFALNEIAKKRGLKPMLLKPNTKSVSFIFGKAER